MGRIFETRKATMFARWDRWPSSSRASARTSPSPSRRAAPTRTATRTLRRVIQNARAVNMPKDKVEAAIKRASGKDAADYEEVLYEGYAPHGVAVLVETATDNPTRTVANVRTHFNKGGGNLGTTGSVALPVQAHGRVPARPRGHRRRGARARPDRPRPRGDGREHRREGRAAARRPLRASPTSAQLQKALEDRGIDAGLVGARSTSRPPPIELPEDQATEVLELVDQLEQDDDVQQVFHNLASSGGAVGRWQPGGPVGAC